MVWSKTRRVGKTALKMQLRAARIGIAIRCEMAKTEMIFADAAVSARLRYVRAGRSDRTDINHHELDPASETIKRRPAYDL